MYLRLLLLMHIAVLFTINIDVSEATAGENATLQLTVGKEVMIPEVVEESEDEREKEANSTPTTDVIPADKESEDSQTHKLKKKMGKNIESGMPPKYPLKAESAETSAHDNEIGGCRDHPRAGLVCSKCENGNKCFPAEHESYTYSYCRRSCRHCDPSTSSFHTFWRLRAQSEFEPTWMLQQVEFYADPQEKISLVDDPEKAYASSVYTGYKPSFAFDNNNGSAWYPSGWGIHDNNDDWVAYEFTVAVRVHGVRMVVDKDHATAQPKKVIVEASDKMYGPFQKKWTIYNTDYSVDKVYKLLECDVLWRRFEVEDGAWCFRLIAKLETWEGARKACEIEGGDLATVSNKEEQRFITDEVGLCSHTWFGLSHTNEGYYWNDGSNSTYRNWKNELSYSDVQKQTLNCAAMDPEGSWYNFHCSNKFYFVCKKRLVPRAEPRPDLTDNAWPYPPEVPPLIFFAPNVTVPVINSKNLEPGIFPDANGKVEGEDQEEDITLSDLFYEQTVEHLKEKGLKPSEEIEADENQEETDFTQELNKIAINTSPGDYQNETKGDNTKNDTATAHKQEQEFENIPNKEANNAVTNAASANAPKPKPKHKEKPVPPPPEEGDNNGDDNSYPEIVHGKPKDESLKNKNRQGKDVPKGTAGPKDKSSSSMLAAEPSVEGKDEQAGTGKQQVQDEGKAKRKKRKKPSHKNEENGDAGKDQQSDSAASSQYFYVPNQSGSFTLMKMLTPPNNQTGGQPQTGSAASQNTPTAGTPATENKQLAAEPGNPDQSDSESEKEDNKPVDKPAQPQAQAQPKAGQPPQYFYMPNAQGQMTLMKTIMPGTQGAPAAGNQPPKQETPAASKPASDNKQLAAEPGNADQSDSEAEDKDDKEEKENDKPAPPQAPAQPQAQQNEQQKPPQYFYMPNAQGQMTLMKTIMPGTNGAPAAGNQPPKQETPAPVSKPESDNKDLAAEPGNPDQSDSSDEEDKDDKEAEKPATPQAPAAPQAQQQQPQQPQYFYMPNAQGQMTLMKTITPNTTTSGNQSADPKPDTSAAASTPASDAKNLAAEPGAPDQSGAPEAAKTEGAAANAAPAAPAAPAASNQPQPPQYFYMPNAQGQMTLMRTLQPNETAGNQPQQPKQVENANETAAAAPPSNATDSAAAQEQPADKSAEIGKTDDDNDNSKATPQTAAPAAPAAAAQQNGTQPQYFYVPNQNGTYTLMKSLTPNYAGNGAPAAAPQQPPPTPPPPKEGDDDDDSDDSVGEPPDTKKGQNKKADSFKNKEVPMQPFTGPLGGPSLSQQNISKSSRKKIKVLQPLESAAHGEDVSVMADGTKIHKKKGALARHLIHAPKGSQNKAKMSARKKKRNRHLNHLKSKEHDSMHQNEDDGGNADVRHITSHPKVVKQENEEDEEDDDTPDVAESGSESESGSGTQVETDNADIFPEKEEFWSR